tara:strand:- start:2726 stop:2884 length:159 start_codon:yes stop_codon:yes gene_type:complete
MRELPLALGLQMLLWTDLAAGTPMQWSHKIGTSEKVAVDITAQMRASLALSK